MRACQKQLDSFRLENASFAVQAGEYFVLLGESGAGKTVVLELIAGLLSPDTGVIQLHGETITTKRIQDRNISLVYQDHALFPHMTVRRNIAYAIPRQPQRTEELAAMVGATDLLDRSSATLSLGESQRVALARALATEPQILMLDEPLASLDPQAKTGIRSLLRRLNAAGQTIIHVTHDYQEALALASTVAVLEGGGISQVGSPDDVFHHPKSAFVANFVGLKNFFRGHLTRDQGTTGLFRTGDLAFAVSADAADGPGCIVFESKDVTVSRERPSGSARNSFSGTVMDSEPVRLGVEVSVDIGVTVFASVTKGSATEMKLGPGETVWVSFKSTAIRYMDS